MKNSISKTTFSFMFNFPDINIRPKIKSLSRFVQSPGFLSALKNNLNLGEMDRGLKC